jgi:hypothetical protein
VNVLPTVVVASPDAAGAVAGALAARSVSGSVEVLVLASCELPGLFDWTTRRRLPVRHGLMLCGQRVVQVDWDGHPVRSRLMECLRGFVGQVTWYGSGWWHDDDRRAVEHVIGVGSLHLDPVTGSCAVAARAALFGPEDHYEEGLCRAVCKDAGPHAAEQGSTTLRGVLEGLKGDRRALAAAIRLLSAGGSEDVVTRYGAAASAREGANREWAATCTHSPVAAGPLKLVSLSVPADRRVFWAELAGYAREHSGAEVSLCRMEGCCVLMLARGDAPRVDLRKWARYLTDGLPGARMLEAAADAVPILIEGLAKAPELADQAMALLVEGGHLLRQ